MGEMEKGFDWMPFGRGEVGGAICSGLPIGALWMWQESTRWLRVCDSQTVQGDGMVRIQAIGSLPELSRR